MSDARAYMQFAETSVVPIIEVTAKLMALFIPPKGAASMADATTVPNNMVSSSRWTKDQLKLAFYLYCQLSFGKLHSRNPEIIHLAGLLGRTPSAVAMKLVNFASLDPAITNTGRKGLDGASNLDREIWNEFHADWEKLAVECEMLRRNLDVITPLEDEGDELLVPEDYTGETRRVVTEQRIKQNFFRRAVLSSYQGRCCMSGLSEPRLLIASHIVPWSKDKANRLNPSNGLCLSAIHDRAFDKGLIALTDDFRIIVSAELKRLDESFVKEVLVPLSGKMIEFPERFMPSVEFVSRHRADLFVDNRNK